MNDSPNQQAAAQFFVFVAYAFWPLYISLSLALVEWARPLSRRQHVKATSRDDATSSKDRQRSMLAFNVLLSAVLFDIVLEKLRKTESIDVYAAANGHLRYTGWGLNEYTPLGMLVYLYCVVGSLMQSSLKFTNFFVGLYYCRSYRSLAKGIPVHVVLLRGSIQQYCASGRLE
jgi:hypothetical protein